MVDSVILPDVLPVSRKPIFDKFVSVFRNWGDDNWELWKLSEWLFDDQEAAHVLSYRAERGELAKPEIYNSLPFASIACNLRYDPEAADYYPISYTGLMDFDIKQEDNPDFDLCDIAKELAKLPQIAYLGLDTNGIDYFCIIPIAHPERYTDHFRELKKIFGRSGLIISGSENALHTRKLSLDYDCYANDKATVFEIL